MALACSWRLQVLGLERVRERRHGRQVGALDLGVQARAAQHAAGVAGQGLERAEDGGVGRIGGEQHQHGAEHVVAVGDRLQHAQPAARLAVRPQRDAELRDQADRVHVQLRAAAVEGRRQRREAAARAAEQVARGGDEAGARAVGQQHGGEHRVGHAGGALCRVAHRVLDVGGGRRLGGGAGEQLLAGQRLTVRTARVVRGEHQRQRLGGLREQRVGAGSERALAPEGDQHALVERAGDQRRRQHGADALRAQVRVGRLVRLVVVDAQRAAVQRGRLDQRVGGDRDVAGVRLARLDAVGVAQDQVGVTAAADAQPGAVRGQQRPGRGGGDGGDQLERPRRVDEARDAGQRGELVSAGNHGPLYRPKAWRA